MPSYKKAFAYVKRWAEFLIEHGSGRILILFVERLDMFGPDAGLVEESTISMFQ